MFVVCEVRVVTIMIACSLRHIIALILQMYQNWPNQKRPLMIPQRTDGFLSSECQVEAVTTYNDGFRQWRSMPARCDTISQMLP